MGAKEPVELQLLLFEFTASCSTRPRESSSPGRLASSPVFSIPTTVPQNKHPICQFNLNQIGVVFSCVTRQDE